MMSRLRELLRVAAVSGALAVPGTASADFTVTFPNGGEIFAVGDTVTITWTNTDDEYRCHVMLSVDDGIMYEDIYPTTLHRYTDSLMWGHSMWVIPDSLNGVSTVSATCRIEIRPYNANPPANDASDGTFEIKPRGWTPPPPAEKKKGGCGSGAGLAFFPALFYRLAAKRKRR